MKTIILTTICAFGIPLGAMAQNLILNPYFNEGGGGGGGAPLDWNTDANAIYNYYDGSAPSYPTGGEICSFGWWNGCGIWQDTGATIQADTSYVLTVVAEVGQAPVVGVIPAFQDVTTGWTWVVSQEFYFSSADQTDGAYETFSMYIDQSQLTSRVGDDIGVGVNMDDPAQEWLHVDSMYLEAVPEPSTIELLGMGACVVVALIRRKK
jgi:hypothetical protein